MKSIRYVRLRRLEIRATARLKSCIAARDTAGAQRAYDRWAKLFALLQRLPPEVEGGGYSE
jgi:hypothetical protein